MILSSFTGIEGAWLELFRSNAQPPFMRFTDLMSGFLLVAAFASAYFTLAPGPGASPVAGSGSDAAIEHAFANRLGNRQAEWRGTMGPIRDREEAIPGHGFKFLKNLAEKTVKPACP